MTVRLTNYDAGGHRWSPDRTVQVTPRHAVAVPVWDYTRAKASHYEVYDCFTGSTTSVANIKQAQDLVTQIIDSRPHLEWGQWHQPRQGVLNSAAQGPLGPIVAWAHTQEDPAGGLWAVGFEMELWTASWLSSVRHRPHRLLMVQACAERRMFQRYAQKIEEGA